jgi:hypothetical protein
MKKLFLVFLTIFCAGLLNSCIDKNSTTPKEDSITIYANTTMTFSVCGTAENIVWLLDGVSNDGYKCGTPGIFYDNCECFDYSPTPSDVSIMPHSLSFQEQKTVFAEKKTWSITVNDALPGPIAYYPFNGNANDMSGNGHDGVVNGAVLATDRYGNSNSAYSFDGLNDSIDLTNTGSFNFSAFTLSAWVNYTDTNDDSIIIAKHISNSWNGYFLGVGGNEFGVPYYNSLTFYLNQPNRLYTPDTYNDEMWHNVVGVYDGTNQYLYVDGDMKCSQQKSFTNINTADIFIGTASGNIFPKNYFRGLIDDVRVYDRALSAAEIQQLAAE